MTVGEADEHGITGSDVSVVGIVVAGREDADPALIYASARGEFGGCGPKGGTQAERDEREALGRSRGGFGTKACVIADGRGRAIAFALAPGQAHELPLAPGLLNCLPDVPG